MKRVCLGLISLLLGNTCFAGDINLGLSQTAVTSESAHHDAQQMMYLDTATNAWRQVTGNSNGAINTVGASGGTTQGVTLQAVAGSVAAKGITVGADTLVGGAVVSNSNPMPVSPAAAGIIAQESGGNLDDIDANTDNLPLGIGALTGTATVTSRFAMNPVTYASSVQGTSMAGLTFSARASLEVANNGTKVLSVIITNSSTAPTNTNVQRTDISAGEKMVWSVRLGTLSVQDSVVHWYNQSAETVTNTATYRY
jgi:hypothetical protein